VPFNGLHFVTNAHPRRVPMRLIPLEGPRAVAAHGLVDELRDSAGARRAVLMAEILGPPVSMRR
jgi:hypothetical protein